MHSAHPEEDRKEITQIEKKKMKEKKIEKDEKQKIAWILCSDDWRDIVTMYVPQLNNIPIEDNYAEISHKEIKKAYKQYKRRAQMQRAK